MKKLAIVGYGSIGKRHYSNFTKLGAEVAVITKQSLDTVITYSDLEACVSSFKPDMVFICNETYLHSIVLNKLRKLNFKGYIIVEKPILNNLVDIDVNDQYFHSVKVAYNFRFNPMLLKLKDQIQDEKVTSVTCYVGQYLPTWRPNSDYRNSYSAFREKGGGVVLDLSHEIDYCCWLFGSIVNLYAQGGHLSDLEIKSEDSVSIISSHKKSKLVNINLNYTDRITNRYLIVNTNKKTFKLDFIKKTFQVNDNIETYNYDTNEPYIEMAKAILNSNFNMLAGFKEACHVVDVTDKVFKSIEEKRSIEV